jgi:hypothetical protein
MTLGGMRRRWMMMENKPLQFKSKWYGPLPSILSNNSSLNGMKGIANKDIQMFQIISLMVVVVIGVQQQNQPSKSAPN